MPARRAQAIASREDRKTAWEPVGCINTISLQIGRIQSTNEFVHPTGPRKPVAERNRCFK
jgi:hypothetical protein